MALTAAVVAAPASASAQDGDDWSFEAEVGGQLFFGNTQQTIFTTRAGAEVADSVRELSFEGRFSYGEATNDADETFVNQRAWTFGANFDYRPFARLSPFLFAELERSLQRRIALRYNFGFGGKYRIQRSDRGRVDFSAALLGEQTDPRGEASPSFNDDLRARWSFRARADRSWDDDRLRFESETFYRPQFGEWGDFTFTFDSSLSFRLNETISLKLTFLDQYDSEAEERGARSNNDGRFLVTLLSTF